MFKNLSMMTDLYQLTMMNGYFVDGTHNNEAVFDMFYRRKEGLDYCISAGLEQLVDYIKNLKFTDDDVAYLQKRGGFNEGFLRYLRELKFTGDIYAVQEGEVIFPYEPLMRVKAPLIQAQLIETAALNILNHQTLIATKASRVVHAAQGKSVVEFGLRRAHGPDAGIYGARAAVIGGCGGTSNVLAGQLFDVAIKGTQSHSWVMSYEDELTAFERFADIYPDGCLLLVDTYDTLGSGVPNAIKVFKKLREKGHKPVGIRIDSGDLAYLSKKARQVLDDAGFKDAIIFASGDLDEEIITSLNVQGAHIDAYGVGTKLITSESNSSLGGVYKLSGVYINGEFCPRMKISDNPEKMTNPGLKKVYRIYGKDGMAEADLIALEGESLKRPLVLKHETLDWKKKAVDDYTFRELLTPVFLSGKVVYQKRSVAECANYSQGELNRFWEEYKRLLNPHIYKVNVSEGLKKLKMRLLKEHSVKGE
ncbi:MAG: nicotinate phosphoribosyltransferase [Firmicutes bacterium]|nr:nicotinate phosphoribosyltransferase [Bacillota bacterium]